MLVPLAGGGQETLLSEVGFVLLPLFTTRDACALRLVCREFLAAVTEQPWEDRETVIQGSIAAWRACFPHARCANVQKWDWPLGANKRASPAVDADFVHFEGLRELNMRGCRAVTDAAFVHLRGIHSLDMSECSQLTDAAFVHLAGIQRLSMYGCQGISDAALVYLRGIQMLNIGDCTQLTDAAFGHLRGIKFLSMESCDQSAITDAAFGHLRGIRVLDMELCRQDTITGATFSSLAGVEFLYLCGCGDELAAAASALGLPISPDIPDEWLKAFFYPFRVPQ